MLIRNPSNTYELVDLTGAVRNLPIQYGSFNALGLFTEEPVMGDTVVFEETTQDGALLVDMVRGTKPTAGKDGTRKLHSFIVPHFPSIDFITPKDLKQISAYDNFNETEQLEKVRARKLLRLRQNHDWTLNKARAQALFSGTAYAPNGTITQDWNTEFSVTRTAVDFDFGNSSADILAKCELVIQAVHDGMGGSGGFTDIIVPCHTGFFNKLIAHASVTAAYKYFTSIQQGLDPMRSRLAAGGSAVPNGRQFRYGGLLFQEIRDSYNGTALCTTNEGVAVPQGTETFKTYFGSAERFGLVNTLGEKLYAFEQANTDNTQITIETESNHISALLRPKAVIRCYSGS